jgi:hypothetical protein
VRPAIDVEVLAVSRDRNAAVRAVDGFDMSPRERSDVVFVTMAGGACPRRSRRERRRTISSVRKTIFRR